MGLNHNDGYVPIQTRSERPASQNPADFAAVTGRETEWRWTPVAQLQQIFSGDLVSAKPRFTATEVEGASVSFVPKTDARLCSVYKPEDLAAAQAWANLEEALAIEVSGELSESLVVRLSGYGLNPAAGHIFIDIAAHAKADIVLIYEGAAHLSETVEIKVGDGATANVITIGEFNNDAIHVSAHHALVGRDASLKHIAVSLTGKIVRLNPSVHLANPGGNAELYGLYYADPGQHLEHQVWVNHIAPNCRSRVTYKGALQGQGARTVWIGDVLIGAEAKGTDSYEENRNLVLGSGPIADSIPNLEIECGDIEGAGHASATGRFEEDQLFYLMARGIDEFTARRLVVRGFLNEIVQQIEDENIARELTERLEIELAASDAAIAASMKEK